MYIYIQYNIKYNMDEVTRFENENLKCAWDINRKIFTKFEEKLKF